MDLTWVKNQAAGAGRGGIWFLAGVAVGKGWIDGDNAIVIGGAVLTLIGGSLTGLANTNSSITSAFSQIPSTKRITTSDPELAEVAKKADPSTVVTVSTAKES